MKTVKINIRPVKQKEMKFLCQLDVKIFGSDGFESLSEWEGLKTFFIIHNKKIIGNISFSDSSNSFYLASIGILPEKQGMNIGSKAMEWAIKYAKKKGFKKITSNCRKSNLKSIKLHKKYSFKISALVPKWFENPIESAYFFELTF